MPFRIAILAVSACAPALASDSVNDVVSLVRSAIARQRSDRSTARVLRRIKLTESLDQHTIEELESEGAGPLTIDELERLRQVSALLPLPATTPKYKPWPAPSPAEQRSTLEQARASALNYTRSLPDFICTEMVRRYDESRGRLMDTLTLKSSKRRERDVAAQYDAEQRDRDVFGHVDECGQPVDHRGGYRRIQHQRQFRHDRGGRRSGDASCGRGALIGRGGGTIQLHGDRAGCLQQSQRGLLGHAAFHVERWGLCE